MANRRLTNQNAQTILQDWVQSPINRGDILYFATAEVSGVQIQQVAFGKNLLIKVEQSDNILSKITFLDILT